MLTISPLLPIPLLILVFVGAFIMMAKSYGKIENDRKARYSLLLLRALSLAVLFVISLRPEGAWDNIITYLLAAIFLGLEWYRRRKVGLI